MPSVSASMLYNLCMCPERVRLDLYGRREERDAVTPFLEMLWERGVIHESQVVQAYRDPPLDLSGLKGGEKEAATIQAIQVRHPLIYAGRIASDDLIGEPDLLRWTGSGYQAGDIKSGSGFEGDADDARMKLHYAVQLALYTDILERLGVSDGHRTAFVIDRHGDEVPYVLTDTRGVRNPRTYWSLYEELLSEARGIATKQLETRPAWAAVCKQCHWRTACWKSLVASNDLTLIADLGRTARDALASEIPTVTALATIDLAQFVDKGKTRFKGIGATSLAKFHRRSQLLCNPELGAYVRDSVAPDVRSTEIFFDIEDDPLDEHCYLHGFLIREAGKPERYFSFFADDRTSEAEREAFSGAWDLVRALPADAPIYYYAPHEKTWWRKLQSRHPNVCSIEEVEMLFERAIDLYTRVVHKHSEWPTSDYSVKTLAKHSGFNWRDDDPSGAASIEWYASWCKSKDPSIKQRILAYNEDDCRATAVVLDAVRRLPVRREPAQLG